MTETEQVSRLRWVLFQPVRFAKIYVCVKCGFIEFFIEDISDLPKIAEKYPKIN